jgi:hypothetical protein
VLAGQFLCCALVEGGACDVAPVPPECAPILLWPLLDTELLSCVLSSSFCSPSLLGASELVLLFGPFRSPLVNTHTHRPQNRSGCAELVLTTASPCFPCYSPLFLQPAPPAAFSVASDASDVGDGDDGDMDEVPFDDVDSDSGF